jgi:hypothetical protein
MAGGMKRLSQKSLVDEKGSGRPSILRKVQTMFISKSLHKRRWSTKKLASRPPMLQRHIVHRYLRFNLGAYSCKRPVLRKISKNRTANDFSFPRSHRSGQFLRPDEDHIYR